MPEAKRRKQLEQWLADWENESAYMLAHPRETYEDQDGPKAVADLCEIVRELLAESEGSKPVFGEVYDAEKEEWSCWIYPRGRTATIHIARAGYFSTTIHNAALKPRPSRKDNQS
jgi:hypothetical protein